MEKGNMITRRPHVLRAAIATPAGPPARDADGNTVFPPAPPPVTVEAPCRAESSTVDGRRAVREGTAYDYSFIVYAGAEIPALPIGTEVEITGRRTGELFGTGRVLNFERNQRGTRTWLG